MQTTVTDIMTRDVVTVGPKESVLQAIYKLREGNFRHLPVVEKGRLVGIVSDRDLRSAGPSAATLFRVQEVNYLLDTLPVQDIMTRRVMTVAPGDSLLTAAQLLRRHKIGALPVVHEGGLKGIVSEVDLLGSFIRLLQAESLASASLMDPVCLGAAEAGPRAFAAQAS